MKKKIYSFCFAAIFIALGSTRSSAAVVTVNVQDFEFTPADFSIAAGDTVMWMWDNNAGNHNTTSGTIPAGATSWAAPINSSSPMFMYVPLVAGSYSYNCTFHVSMGMTGHFTVAGSSGISDLSDAGMLHLSATSPATSLLKFQYGISEPGMVNVHLFDILGNKVQTFLSSRQHAGTYDAEFDIQMLHGGVYMLVLQTESAMVSRRVVVQ